MIFFGNGIVWDKENNKVLCKFVAGQFETEDVGIAKKLIGRYKYEGEIPEMEVEKLEQPETNGNNGNTKRNSNRGT